MQYIALRSGLIIRFDEAKVTFEFNQKGYFVGDVALHNPETQRPGGGYLTSFRSVESFTFHMDEISAHWVE